MSVRGCHHSTDAEACLALQRRAGARKVGNNIYISARGCHHSTTRNHSSRVTIKDNNKSRKAPVIGTWHRPQTVMPLFQHVSYTRVVSVATLCHEYMVTIRSCVFRDRLLGRYPAGNSSQLVDHVGNTGVRPSGSYRAVVLPARLRRWSTPPRGRKRPLPELQKTRSRNNLEDSDHGLAHRGLEREDGSQ
jgi:hypothetical protein